MLTYWSELPGPPTCDVITEGELSSLRVGWIHINHHSVCVCVERATQINASMGAMNWQCRGAKWAPHLQVRVWCDLFQLAQERTMWSVTFLATATGFSWQTVGETTEV